MAVAGHPGPLYESIPRTHQALQGHLRPRRSVVVDARGG